MNVERCANFLLSGNAEKRVREQRRARSLLFEGFETNSKHSHSHIPEHLSDATEIFIPDAVQQEIYQADTGTHILPALFKKMLASIGSAFIIRPGCIADLQTFIRWAAENRKTYTIRGAGTWPFGGCVPLNGDIVVDLSSLNFLKLDAEGETLTLGAGVLFTDARTCLKSHGFALRVEITNPYSGTIAGWIATGGLGLGTYKYGHVSESVLMLLIVTPDGELHTLTHEDEDFPLYFGSEGQLGVIAGAVIRIRRESFISKPYAFSFHKAEDAHQFITLIRTSRLNPTSVIFFGKTYIQETCRIEKKQLQHQSEDALSGDSPVQLAEAREDLAIIGELKDQDHIVLIHFDSHEDYQQALKSRFFGSGGERLQVNHISYVQLSGSLAHHLWEHRFLPVQIKQSGPSLLVTETVLPLDRFSVYQKFLRKILYGLLDIELKTEAHLLRNDEMLVQSLFLADTRTLRHKIYFALVPLMTQVAYAFGARPYGIGMWNYPSIKKWREFAPEKADALIALRRKNDPHGLINRGKFLNPRNHKLFFKMYKTIFPVMIDGVVKIFSKHQEADAHLFQRLLGKSARYIFPRFVPSGLKANGVEPISEIISVCAECDCCERVCPTSDVFGLYGPATPITRRKTAQRLADNKTISKQEALGFLACTRCDNCTRICPTDIPLTDLFDLVEKNKQFRSALNLEEDEAVHFIDRFWQIMKESPLYREHTIAEQKEDRSHLAHGLKILYEKGFEYSHLSIDPDTCIHCGMCTHENACMYGARQGIPRSIPQLIDMNCALCNACVNFCPKNKLAQDERAYLDRFIRYAPDLDEKKYWLKKQNRIHDTTTVNRSALLTEMSDRYVTEEIIMEIDKEASTGKIPVSGSGQGDRHMGIGFDAERFAHFHIVGPAQNRLHEGDPAEELSVTLGKREDFCKFDPDGNLINPTHPNIKLMTPILYNAIPLESNGKVELTLIRVAEKQKSLVVIPLERLLENYQFTLREGPFERLPPVIIPRVDHGLIHRLIVNPRTDRDFLTDLWRMPVFEVEYDPNIERTLTYIKESVAATSDHVPLICGYLEISEYDLIGSLTLTTPVKEKINHFLDQGVDILHIHGLRNKDEYYVTSSAVRALHHYLLRIGRRHDVSIIASGGIRLASDTQKTIQRGAEATLIDFAALLALDPSAYRAIIEQKATTERLLSLDTDAAVKRLNYQAESRKVQILEVLGASGFKDIKKTVGEEGRLIDFYKLENRIQRSIFQDENVLAEYIRVNEEMIRSTVIPESSVLTYDELKNRIHPMPNPHHFYRLGEENQKLYQRDFVWPGPLIESMGRMATGDLSMLDFRHVKATGLLGDGFDVMRILYNKDPMDIAEADLRSINTAIRLDKGLLLKAPWMFGGKSVGSIGLDTWRAHVMAVRELGIQVDTGEGGYPTCFFLNSKGEPLFFTENEIQRIKPYFESGQDYTIQEIQSILNENGISEDEYPEIYRKMAHDPALKPFHFMVVVDEEDQPFISTELKTGLFGVTSGTIKKARRIVIAYSQGAKMGIGGHILAQKVNKLVSYMRGVEGIERLHTEKVEKLFHLLQRNQQKADQPLSGIADQSLPVLEQSQQRNQATAELKTILKEIQDQIYQLQEEGGIDPLEFNDIVRLCEEIIEYSYSSIISPFPFHNCYSIEDVKAFIDVVRMINPQAVISIKVSPSIDIEFIAAGLGRIAKDNTEEMLKVRFGTTDVLSPEMSEYAAKYGMKIEIWLDGPRGGTGASPNIIKGQMGMHIEYAIPLIHHRLVKDGLRNYVSFMVSGGIRTYEDVIKAVALGADGVIWGTAPLVAIGCDRNRNCHDGCSRGIATSNLVLQKLRDVDINKQQMINAFTMIQMQVMRSLAAMGFRDIKELRGRFDKIHWLGLKERVDHRYRVRTEVIKEIEKDERQFEERMAHATGQSNCGVAAISGTVPVPAYILDQTLQSMRNRGMDGVGVAKTLCFPDHPDEYAFRVMVKGLLQRDVEETISRQWGKTRKKYTEQDLRQEARRIVIRHRCALMSSLKTVFLDPYFTYTGPMDPVACRESYKVDSAGRERDFREFGDPRADPGDIFRYSVRVKKQVLHRFIEDELLKGASIVHLHPGLTLNNYKKNRAFLGKAEDQFVFYHSLNLTRVLYVFHILPHELEAFAGKRIRSAWSDEATLFGNGKGASQIACLKVIRDFVAMHAYEHHKHRYGKRIYKIAAVMSCGKNFAVWKTAGREIPWQTPDAPNNIIHVRLATGSDVEQMNSHPFAKLHTALTHNGETTNYEALKQRVEQFNISPLAGTDTEVASLKFHLIAEAWEYPDWALFESFSPTTGDDLQLVSPGIRGQLEGVQRVEFASSPDGPYQYLCLRHQPKKRLTERVDLKDPADLRPNVSALWYDEQRAFSMIASEEHAIHRMMELLDQEGIVDGSFPDHTFVSSGMISRFQYDDLSRINGFELINRYGERIALEPGGTHYSLRREKLLVPKDLTGFSGWKSTYREFFTNHLAGLSFNQFRWLLHEMVDKTCTDEEFTAHLDIVTWLRDYLRTLNPGDKAQGSLLSIAQDAIDRLLNRAQRSDFYHYVWCNRQQAASFSQRPEEAQRLVIDAEDFLAEGIDPDFALVPFLSKVYSLGWRNLIIYRARGQRLISTAALGRGDTDDVVMDVYGAAGEYFGAFMQGGILRLHGNAQNFCGMCMHHGELYVFGNAGKVCGYASKGGKVFIMGNVVDRCWTNSVNDSRCQDLDVWILGSATKYAGESLMGGNFFFGGLHFDNRGKLRFNERPYLGTKMLGGASRGNFVIFDPEHRLVEAQYVHGYVKEISSGEWQTFRERILKTFRLSNIPVSLENGDPVIRVNEKTVAIVPRHFKLIVPRGGLKGYESH